MSDDPFNLGRSPKKIVEKITVTRTRQIRVTRPWRSGTRIRWKFFGSMTRTSRGDRAFSSCPGSFQVAVKVVIAGRRRRSSGSFQLRRTEGSLSRFYERLAVTSMECVTSYVHCMLCQCIRRTRFCRDWDEPKR